MYVPYPHIFGPKLRTVPVQLSAHLARQSPRPVPSLHMEIVMYLTYLSKSCTTIHHGKCLQVCLLMVSLWNSSAANPIRQVKKRLGAMGRCWQFAVFLQFFYNFFHDFSWFLNNFWGLLWKSAHFVSQNWGLFQDCTFWGPKSPNLSAHRDFDTELASEGAFRGPGVLDKLSKFGQPRQGCAGITPDAGKIFFLTSNNFDWNEVPSDIYSIFPLKNEPLLSHAGQVKHLVSKALIQHQPWVMNTRLFFMFLF
jgi:hypothetical protein